jgi:hypothetical protein
VLEKQLGGEVRVRDAITSANRIHEKSLIPCLCPRISHTGFGANLLDQLEAGEQEKS